MGSSKRLDQPCPPPRRGLEQMHFWVYTVPCLGGAATDATQMAPKSLWMQLAGEECLPH